MPGVATGALGGGGGGSMIALRASGEAGPDSITTSICFAWPETTLNLLV
jgi:hypothetical protein